jgi:hypothetical protein
MHKPIEVSLGVAMQMPIRRIERDVNVRDHPRISVDFGKQHQAIGAAALDPAHMMIGCAEPALSFGKNH